MHISKRTTLSRLLRSGVSAVEGDVAVRNWLETTSIPAPTKILAIGKAAASMQQGLPKKWCGFTPTLLVTKTGHTGSARLSNHVDALEASHPVPDQTSLLAGQKAIDFVSDSTENDRLIILLSGGASSLVEHLQEGVNFNELIDLTNAALSNGANIAEINRRRKTISAIKGGKLLSNFTGSRVDVLAISDVCGDEIRIIGSGIGAAPENPRFSYHQHIVASNFVAREAIIREATSNNLRVVINAETMYDDVCNVADRITNDISLGPPGLYLYGGEPTIVLPDQPGEGGRNQALALELAKRMRDQPDVVGIVAGTDGTDGTTTAAGAFFDATTFDAKPGAEEALARANSACFLADIGDQLITGPTGTNVMDLAILIKNH